MEWKKTLGGEGFDELRDVLIEDDGYVLVGTNEDTLENVKEDVYLLKLGLTGEELWTYTYGGAENQRGNALAKLPSGNIIFIGSTTTAGNITESNDGVGVNPVGIKDGYIAKVSTDGGVLLDSFQYGSSEDDEFTSINIKSGTNDIFCTGTMRYSNDADALDNQCISVFKFQPGLTGALDPNYYGTVGNDRSSYSLIKNGKLLFLGSKNSNTSPFVDLINDLDNLSSTSDDFNFVSPVVGNVIINGADKSGDGYILAGSTDGEGNGAKDVLLIKINSNAEIEWYNTYGGEGDDEAYSVETTSDGGYVVAATSTFGSDQEIMLLKVTSEGELK